MVSIELAECVRFCVVCLEAGALFFATSVSSSLLSLLLLDDGEDEEEEEEEEWKVRWVPPVTDFF